MRVTVDTGDDVDIRSVDAVKPAHIPHRVEVVSRSEPPPREPTSEGGHREIGTDAVILAADVLGGAEITGHLVYFGDHHPGAVLLSVELDGPVRHGQCLLVLAQRAMVRRQGSGRRRGKRTAGIGGVAFRRRT
ncbi:hypothetical protein [Mycolicibacterium goodii]|uniref:hypothetical protein n=1 Tax=Mycolicibacterium goodii TaxID=134601 RepID=UPI0012FF6408